MKSKTQNKGLELLYQAILSLKNEEDCKDFLEDLVTRQELESFAGRIKSASLLMQGKTYVEVIDETHISSATLARVSKCIKYGTGYNKVLRPLVEKENEKKN